MHRYPQFPHLEQVRVRRKRDSSQPTERYNNGRVSRRYYECGDLGARHPLALLTSRKGGVWQLK